jgi:hypothetical protein
MAQNPVLHTKKKPPNYFDGFFSHEEEKESCPIAFQKKCRRAGSRRRALSGAHAGGMDMRSKNYLVLMGTSRAFASSALGIVTVRTPLSISALTFSALTEEGRVKLR